MSANVRGRQSASERDTVGFPFWYSRRWLVNTMVGPVAYHFSEDPGTQALLSSKKSQHGFPLNSSNPSCSEVHMTQATTLQSGEILHRLHVTVLLASI